MSAIASVTGTGASAAVAAGSTAVAASSAQSSGTSSAASSAYALSDKLSALISGNEKNQQSATLQLLTGNSASDDSSDVDTLITQYQQATNLTYAESQYLQTLQSGAASASSQPTGSSSATSGAYTLSPSLSALIAENEKNQQSSFVQMLTGTSDSDSSDSEARNLISQYEQATNVTYAELQYLQTMQSGTTTAATTRTTSSTAADTAATTANTNTSAAATSPSIGGQVDVSA